MIYTPFYTGPHTGVPSFPLLKYRAGSVEKESLLVPTEKLRAQFLELHKDSLIYGLAISRTYDGVLTRVSPNTGVLLDE
jgi:hypothetical protein